MNERDFAKARLSTCRENSSLPTWPRAKKKRFATGSGSVGYRSARGDVGSPMSALGGKADMPFCTANVRF